MKVILNWLLKVAGPTTVSMLINKYLTKENIQKAILELLEVAEKLAEKTETKIDDQIVAKLKEIVG